MVISVVMKVENSIDFRVTSDSKVIYVLYTFRNSLPRVFLHLDVVELPETITVR